MACQVKYALKEKRKKTRFETFALVVNSINEKVDEQYMSLLASSRHLT
jgi:hypothetical protein